MLLFAVRESVQESLWFNPYEIVFGHTLRRSLKLLKEKFLSDDDSSLNLIQYLCPFSKTDNQKPVKLLGPISNQLNAN